MPTRTPRARASANRSDQDDFDDYDPEAFGRPSVAVDLVALTVLEDELRVLCVRRGESPFRGQWALPGGFVRVGKSRSDRGESLDGAMARELREETGLDPAEVYTEQLGAFGAPDRDPRMRVISVAYYALVRPDLVPRVRAGGDAERAEWLAVDDGLRLAFDHRAIVDVARTRVRERIHTTSLAASLVPSTFSIPELRRVYAVVTGEPIDAGNFRRKFLTMLEAGVVEQAEGKRVTTSKPAAVYRFVGR